MIIKVFILTKLNFVMNLLNLTGHFVLKENYKIQISYRRCHDYSDCINK